MRRLVQKWFLSELRSLIGLQIVHLRRKSVCHMNCIWQVSMFHGVSASNRTKGFRAIYERKSVGHFKTEEEAARAYDKAAIAKHGRYYPSASICSGMFLIVQN